MSSRASIQAKLPGPPEQVELAYLAALIDRSGGFTAARSKSVGIKISGPAPLRAWLTARFGGYYTGSAWWQTRQADLAFLLPRLRPYLVIRVSECAAMEELLRHFQDRPDYRADDTWRAQRDALMAAVREIRRARGHPDDAEPDARSS